MIHCPRCQAGNPEGLIACVRCNALLVTDAKAATDLTASMPYQPDEIRAGTLLKEKYRILEKIGSGGMGVVYKAEDLRLRRTVALKFLSPGLTGDCEARERFMHEAQAVSELDHPNICTIFELDEIAAGQYYIAMAYYPGENLKSRIKRGRLETAEVLDLAVQLARGLDKAHRRGIVHRDIKPANILITEDGLLKILDFGLAKLAGTTQLTREGTRMGTVFYMSPEQALGQEADHRTDLWSMGVVLYEMLSGRVPFQGERDSSILYCIVHEQPKRLRALRAEVPSELERIVERAMAKRQASRYASAAEMAADLQASLESLRASGTKPIKLRESLRAARKPWVVVPALMVLLVLGGFLGWYFNRQAKISRAREELLPRIEQLVEGGTPGYPEAYRLAVEAESLLPREQRLKDMLKRVATTISITTEPPGAGIYMQAYAAPKSEWAFLGVSPIEAIRLPIGSFCWKMEKEGYETALAVAPTLEGFPYGLPCSLFRRLNKKGSIPAGMVQVEGAPSVGDFFIDRFEVTNKQFKAFIDKGGYRKKEYWKEPFIQDGKTLNWEEALKEFVDQAGQPGPATWLAGDYPEGQEDYPVSGVSWYEAAAYAEFMRKSLPTSTHWGIARGDFTPFIQHPNFDSPVLHSNFNHKGSAPVGSYPGMTSFGAYDMAGNVREWCWNQSSKGRIIRGGAWDDAIYLFKELSQAPPFNRSPRNGFRCALYPDPDKNPKSAFEPVIIEVVDYYKEKAATEEVFQVFKDQVSYDNTQLNARIEWRKESSEDWIQEKVSFDAAYQNERIIAYLFLPRKGPPPYQTVIYFPGGGACYQKSSQDIEKYGEFDYNLSFLVKNGRAVLFPLYAGTFERSNSETLRIHEGPADTRENSEFIIKHIQDFKKSIDYLATRMDIDGNKLAYLGWSFGGIYGAMFPAVEDRLRASVLLAGGFWPGLRPEVRPTNFVSRVRIPTLMLNGWYDLMFPYEQSVKPMFDLLGTPADRKALKLYNTDHYIPRNDIIKETLAWLDRYLGPVS